MNYFLYLNIKYALILLWWKKLLVKSYRFYVFLNSLNLSIKYLNFIYRKYTDDKKKYSKYINAL